MHGNSSEQVKRVITISSRQVVGGASPAQVIARLLVSVRSPEEAVRAIAGGAEIVDVKEPERGSLGMADIPVIAQIAQQLGGRGPGVPLSVALGELREWSDRADIPALPPEVSFAKLGLSGLADDRDWPKTWNTVRCRIEQEAAGPLRWVAVAYADQAAAGSPTVDQVLEAAVQSGCAGLLMDTFVKQGGTILDSLPKEQLGQIADRCHASGLFFAVAGRMTAGLLSAISGVPADIVAIRTAACRSGNRLNGIDAALVAEFRSAMRRNTA